MGCPPPSFTRFLLCVFLHFVAHVQSMKQTRCAKVFWDNGAHTSRLDRRGNRMAPPLSKLHRAGKAELEAAGWRKASTGSSVL
jgi:hypothetical protein